MRMLGSMHSVFFKASTELVGYTSPATGVVGGQITSKDVLDWSIRETLYQIRTYWPLWIHQGFKFDARNTSWERWVSFPRKISVSQRERATHVAHSARVQEGHGREVAQEKEKERQIAPSGSSTSLCGPPRRQVARFNWHNTLQSPAIIISFRCLFQTTLGNFADNKFLDRAVSRGYGSPTILRGPLRRRVGKSQLPCWTISCVL